MKHEAISPPLDASDEQPTRLAANLPLVPGLPVTDAEIAAADAEAMAAVEAGQVYSHELVGEWIATISEPGYRPFDEWLAARNG